MKAGRLDRIRPAAVGAGRWAVGTRRNTGPSRRARSGPAAVDTRRWAGQWAVGFGLALLLLLVWPTQVSAQTPPPPAPGAGGEIVEYYATDALGSIRVVFTAAGAEVARADYLPFGERFTATGPLPPQQFTGQQRDPEAQLDHFNARSYQTNTGRFTGIDPVYAGLFDPQQWNRYGYARANPLKYVDPQGLETFRISVNCSETFNVGCTQDPKAGTGPVGPSAWFLFGGMNPFGVSYPERTLPLSFFTKGNHRPSRDDRAIGDAGANVVSPESPNDPVPPKRAPDPESDPCLTNTSGIQFVDFGGFFSPILGADVSVGLWRDAQSGAWGVHYAAGLAVGLGYGFGVGSGQVRGWNNFRGVSIHLQAGVGPYGIGAYRDQHNRLFTGVETGLGGRPALPSLQWNWGGAVARTTTTPIVLKKGKC